jgi:hypothetical protein
MSLVALRIIFPQLTLVYVLVGTNFSLNKDMEKILTIQVKPVKHSLCNSSLLIVEILLLKEF